MPEIRDSVASGALIEASPGPAAFALITFDSTVHVHPYTFSPVELDMFPAVSTHGNA